MVALIYVLIDPRTGEIRYVGWTNRTLERRLRHHIREKRTFHRGRWVQQLRRENLKPLIRLVQTVPLVVWQDAERYWIRFHREQGCPLTNGTDGGEGSLGRVVTEETRTKMRAALGTGPGSRPKRSQEFRDRQRLALLARVNPATQEAVREKISQTKTGRKLGPQTPEHRKRISTARKAYYERLKNVSFV